MVQHDYFKTIALSFIGVVFITRAGILRAQCPIPCSQEQFPYDFCPNPNGPAICSSDPNADGTPAKAWLPNSACVTSNMIGYATHQPLGPVPGPNPGDPGVEPVNPGDPGAEPSNPGDPGVEPTNPGNPGAEPDEPQCCIDDDCIDPSICDTWASQDQTWQIEEDAYLQWESDDATWQQEEQAYQDWQTADAQWQTDEQAYQDWQTADAAWQTAEQTYTDWQTTCSEVQYVTVWDDAQAKIDANTALNEWYSACPGLATHDCCLNVDLNNNANAFNNNGSWAIGFTPFPAGCPETSCASDTRDVNVNVSNAFLYNSYPTDPNPQPDPDYPIVICDRTWYTGQIHPNVNAGMQDYSFLQLCEHEMGHFLGFRHPNADGEVTCTNNVTLKCQPSIMWQGENGGPGDPDQVSCEDKNMFRRLYCPSTPCVDCAGSGVSETREQGDLNAGIFPNPTTGACLLQYYIANRSFVQIAIYDMLGNRVLLVYSGYQEPGEQSISLGTESLPSGHYVCRVRVGESVMYINMVIQK